MSNASAAPAFKAMALFCDDVRHELGGKVSLIGVYGPTLIATTAGRPLPRLVAFVSLVYPLDAVGSNVHVQVLENELPVVDAEVPLPQPAPMAQVRPDQPPQQSGLLSMPIEVQGYVPHNGARLQVRLAVNGFEFAGPELNMVAPDPAPPTTEPADRPAAA